MPQDDDGWGPPTAVYSAAAARDTGARDTRRRPFYPSSPPPADAGEAWAPAGPRSGREQRAVRTTDRRTQRSVDALTDRRAVAAAGERGVRWWAAVLVLIVIAAFGGLVDTLGAIQGQGGFNVGVVVASIVAILIVKRSHMFPVVIAPPIIYSASTVLQLYVRSGGLQNKRVVLDAAANYLVYGFPAIAAATAAVLIVAGVRLIIRR